MQHTCKQLEDLYYKVILDTLAVLVLILFVMFIKNTLILSIQPVELNFNEWLNIEIWDPYINMKSVQ